MGDIDLERWGCAARVQGRVKVLTNQAVWPLVGSEPWTEIWICVFDRSRNAVERVAAPLKGGWWDP